MCRKASSGETGTEQGGSEGKRAKCDSSDGNSERKRENIQHPRKAVKKIKKQPDIRHAFSDPAHGSRVRLSASLTNLFQAPILWQEVDHDPMPMDVYEGSSEQSRCDVVSTNSSSLSPRDLPPLQLKVSLPHRFGHGLCGQRHGLAMNWVDWPRTSADKRDVVCSPRCRHCV